MAGQDVLDAIEIHVPELDTTTAVACIIGGVVLGGILIYALMQQNANGRLRSPFVPTIIDPIDDRTPGTAPIPQGYYSQDVDNG